MPTKHHRLPREHYVGRISAFFTLCVADSQRLFSNAEVVQIFVDFLKKSARKDEFCVVYCFMPEHLHLVLIGRTESSNVLRGIETFKQTTGYWLGRQYSELKWRRSFYDRIIRHPSELAQKIRYTIENPVRRGLVNNWQDYPYTGAIGLDLNELLSEMLRL
jgi:putative transposase